MGLPKLSLQSPHKKNERKQRCLEGVFANLENNFDGVYEITNPVLKDCHRRYCCEKGGKKPYLKPHPKHHTKAHVWAGISKKGAAEICILEGT